MSNVATEKKQLSPHAAAAKAIRDYLKSIGVKATVTSDSYSMGNSVSVGLQDLEPTLRKQIEASCAQYQYGHFDGMQDLYTSSNRRTDIPQAKYVQVSCDYSKELQQKAWEVIRGYYGNDSEGSEFPALLENAQNVQVAGAWAPTIVYRFLNGSQLGMENKAAEFWNSLKPKAPVVQLHPVAGAKIVEHFHTKHNFTMYIVVLADKIPRAAFDVHFARCKELGGWYTRQFGDSPAGFAFKEMVPAQTMLEEVSSGEKGTTAEPGSPVTSAKADKPTNNPALATKFRDLADGLQSKINSCFGDRLENTPKRMKQGASARLEGQRQERTQKVLRALADMHDAGTVPVVLQGVKSKADVYAKMAVETSHIANGFHSYSVDTGKPYYKDPLALALWQLLAPPTQEQKDAEALRQKLNGLKFSNIPGYFPTPEAVVQEMVDRAQLRAGMYILEPSAGSGNIACHVRDFMEDEVTVVVFEVNHTLCDVLKLRGFDARPVDFMEQQPGKMLYDRVLMNPPFENTQDIDHVLHAFKFLKPRGRLVAVMSPAFQHHSSKKAEAFRQWVQDIGAEVVKLPEGSFKESGTGVSTVLLIADKEWV